MSEIINFWKNTAKFSSLFQWLLENTQEIKVVSYKSDPELKLIIEEFLKMYKPQIKRCYDNSIKLSLFNDDIDYVLGYTHCGFPIEHAWNHYKGIYFDLTAEIALDKSFSEHILVKTYNTKGLLTHFEKTDYPPDFMNSIIPNIKAA